MGRGVGDGPLVGSGVAVGIGVRVGSGVIVADGVNVGVTLGISVGGPSVSVSRGCVGSGGGVHEGGSVGRFASSVDGGAAQAANTISVHKMISGKRVNRTSLGGGSEWDT